MGRVPACPEMPLSVGYPWGPSAHPIPTAQSSFPAGRSKAFNSPAHQRAGDQPRSHLWRCNQRLGQKTSAGEPDLDGHQQLQPFHTPCQQSGKPSGCSHNIQHAGKRQLLLIWVPSAKGVSLGGMGYGCTIYWDILRAGGAAEQHWCWNSGFPQQVSHRG